MKTEKKKTEKKEQVSIEAYKNYGKTVMELAFEKVKIQLPKE